MSALPLFALNDEIGRDIPWRAVTLGELLRTREPCYVGSGSNITALSLAGLGLTTVPTSLQRFHALEILRLTENALTDLPGWLSSCQRLVKVYLSWNQFAEPPLALRSLPRLTVLALNHNPIGGLPGWFSQLPILRTLGLQSTGLSTVPPVLRQMDQLRCLFLSGNPIDDIPQWIGELRYLRQLSLTCTNVSGLPDSLRQLRHLNSLMLDETAMTAFPECVMHLRRLGMLSLERTRIGQIPADIARLSRLTVLNLNGTAISHLPDGIGQLRRLRRLHVGDTALTEIPDTLAQLHRLSELDLHGTRISHIPQTIARLRGLRRLDLSNADLLQLSPAVLKMPNLSVLNVSSNRLRELPLEIAETRLRLIWSGRRTADTGIFLHRNPLTVPPPEIYRQGDTAVRTYLRSLRTQTQRTNEVKVLLIGDGGAGKTSLVRRLTNETFIENESATRGIVITDGWIGSGSQRTRLHFWDFGGQEIMHATHQFFLSHRSIYVLVIDGRRDEKAEYWLKHIEAFGGSSPAIVVVNKMDENPNATVNRRFLGAKYPFIVDFVQISCKMDQGMEQIRLALQAAIQKVDFVRTEWPVSWLVIKDRVLQKTDDFIALSDFQAICRAAGVVAEVEQETLIGFLNDLGIVLHFQDLPLRETGVINPRWITSGVYRIISSDVVKSSGGLLDTSKLPQILNPESHPPATYNFIIELMRKFELCYLVEANTVLLPDLLPLEEPAYSLPSEGHLRFVIEYDFLPRSVIARLIVRMHTDIHNGLKWRTGAVLFNSDLASYALVRVDEAERRLHITMQGVYRREYLAILLDGIRQINRSFTGIKVSERMMLPDNAHVSVTYAHLLKLESLGISSFVPDGAEHEYVVGELLGWVQPRRRTEEEILDLLRKLQQHADTEETQRQKDNAIAALKRNLWGTGLDKDEMIKRVFPSDKTQR